MNIQATLDKVKALYLSHFPNGYIKFTKYAYSDNNYYISVGVIKKESDCPHNIRQNDNGYGLFSITMMDNTIMIERNMHSITTIPRKQFHALGLERVPFRLIKSNEDNALRLFDKYLTRFKTRFIDLIEANEIYHQSEMKSKYLNFHHEVNNEK